MPVCRRLRWLLRRTLDCKSVPCGTVNDAVVGRLQKYPVIHSFQPYECRSINVSTLLNVGVSVSASAEFSSAAKVCWPSFLLIIKPKTGSQDFVLISRFLRSKSFALLKTVVQTH